MKYSFEGTQFSQDMHDNILFNVVGRGGVAGLLNIPHSKARRLIDAVRTGKVKAILEPVPVVSVGTVKVKDNSAVAERDAKVIDLFLSGQLSQRQIAERSGVARTTVQTIIKRHMQSAPTPLAMPVAPVVPVKEPTVIWTAGAKFLNISVDGTVYTANDDHENFVKARQLCIDGNPLKAVDLVNTKKAVQEFTSGAVTIQGNTVKYKDLVISSSLTQRIVNAMSEGKEFKFLVKFFERLMANPSYRAVTDFFNFVDHNDIEIDEEGYVIAFRRVRNDYKDFYTGTMDNSVGKTVEMPRNMVNENPEQTCSNGLHIAAKHYIPHYHGGQGRILKVKVDPADVVSTPSDYSGSKCRVCKFVVLEDITNTFEF